MPAVTLGEGVAPLQRRERCLELAVLVATAHELGLGVKHVLIVVGACEERFELFLALAQGFTKLVDAPVVVGILECAGHVLVNLDIVRHIAELVVIFVTETTC